VRVWPTGGLWRHPDFLRLWSAQTISQFGSQVSQLALPLAAILVLDASAFEVAFLGTVEFLPFLLFALPAGVWVDRLRRKPILVVGDLGRALALGSIPLGSLTGGALASQVGLRETLWIGTIAGSFAASRSCSRPSARSGAWRTRYANMPRCPRP
jgi:MFS family permease